MSKIALSGNASGTGTLTIAAPNTSSDYTLTLPAETGTVTTSGSTPTFTGAVTAPGFIPNSSTVPTNGLYLPATNTPAWASNSTKVVSVIKGSSLALEGATPQAGTGVTFPATQSASTDANTLDDYEEGTFTPTYIGESTAGTTTYTAQYGKYTKIGNTVTIWVDITFTAATGSGSILLGGLPFAVGANPKPMGSCLTNNINWGGGTSLGIYGGDNGTTTLKLYSCADDVGWTENQISNESGRILYNMTYWV